MCKDIHCSIIYNSKKKNPLNREPVNINTFWHIPVTEQHVVIRMNESDFSRAGKKFSRAIQLKKKVVRGISLLSTHTF